MAFPRIPQLTAATPFSRCRLLIAYHPTTQHIPISFYWKPPHSFVGFPGFVTPSPVLLTSAVVRCLLSTSIVFVVVSPLRSTGHYCPIGLLFHSSPPPATGGPGDTNNTTCCLSASDQSARTVKTKSTFDICIGYGSCIHSVPMACWYKLGRKPVVTYMADTLGGRHALESASSVPRRRLIPFTHGA